MKFYLLVCLFLLLSFRVYSQSCTLNVTLSASSPNICSGYSSTLTASASAGTAPYTYVWSTGETTSSIVVDKAGTYTVTVSDQTPGCQPVEQSITIGSSTTPAAPTANGATVCGGSSAMLTATAPGGTYQWYDAATGGNFLASGSTYTTPPITSPTTYYVQTTLSGCTSARTAVQVNVSGNPQVTGATVCYGNVATLMVTGGNSYVWYNSNGNQVSTDSVYTTPALTATTTYYVIAVTNGCSSARTPVTATVLPPPQAPTASNDTICSGSSANLQANGPASDVFNWYNVPTGGVSLISSPQYTTPTLTTTTTYYVQTTSNDCSSVRVPVTVVVEQPPTAPGNQTDSTCYNSSITLTASTNPTGTYQWFDVNGNPLATGLTYTTPVLTNSTTYYVQNSNSACSGPRSTVNVIVKPQVAAPTVPGVIICSGSTATLTSPNQGGVYQWYSAATGGTLLATDASYTTPPLTANTTYYVQRTLSGCTSTRTAVTVTVMPPPTPPTVSGTTTICTGNATVLTANSPYDIYGWYDSAAGGNLLSSGQVYTTPALTSTTTYYVEATSQNGCVSSRTAVTVTVNPDPAAPSASGATICPGTAATLTATAPDTIQWYNVPTAGTLLATGSTYTTPVLYSDTTYYVQNSNATCASSRTPVTVSIVPGTNPEFQYSSGTYCMSGTNPTPVINNPSGGTFSASSAGLVFVSKTTGEINLSASTPGSYTVYFTNNAPCPGTTAMSITLATSVNSELSYQGPFCQGGANPSPNFPPNSNSSAGTFTATPSGLVFVNTSTGQIDLTKSQPGTYTVKNSISASGSCGATADSTTVQIYPKVIVNAGPDQTVATGSTVQLDGSVSGGASTGTWSGGTGSFSNPNSLNATYTPGPGETSATLILTSADPAGPCGPVADTVTITFHFQPNAPTAAGQTICYDSSATLSATEPGGTYRWFATATGDTVLSTGPSFATPALTATTTYYVETTESGVTSSRTAVTVTVNPLPASPTAQNAQVCQGNTATLTATGSTGSYEWYDAATGGNLLSTDSSYTTPVLNYNTSYYVQAVSGTCPSARTEVTVAVSQAPAVTSAAAGTVCSGTALNYTITSNQATATFNWSRAQVTGISNPAVSNQTTSTINETLVNTTAAPVNVTYVITPLIGGCSGAAFNYVVTVNPLPAVTSASTASICNSSATDYVIKFNSSNVNYTWSRNSVAGISNAPVSGQGADTIRETLFNTTNAPANATYVINYSTGACSGTPFNFVVTVNPMTTITSAATGIICNNTPLNYAITSNVPATTYVWSRAAAGNISNPPVSGQTSSAINESLNNTGPVPVSVIYTIIPTAFGCQGQAFTYTVTVYPTFAAPVVNSNSPICVGTTVLLSTPFVSGGGYYWTGPNGFTSTEQNPQIANATTANSGTYTLVNVFGNCPGYPTSINFLVDEPPMSNAGPNQLVCINATQVSLNGSVTGGTSTGIWTTAGSGTFSPASNALNGVYLPSESDKQAGSVTLTLTSTSKDNCSVSMSSMTITFGPSKAADAGPDQVVCSQNTSVQLAGKENTPGNPVWSTLGTGTFSPSADELNASYIPGAADIKNGSVQLILSVLNAGDCYTPTDTMTIKFSPPPKVNAGGTRYVLKGSTITLEPSVSEKDVTYLWSPDIDISDIHIKNPVVTGDIDTYYVLTVTDSLGCVSQDTTYIKVSPQIMIYNTFTPNGDGINDYWVITGLIAYTNATVDVFNRYGQKVYHSIGYPTPWNGTYNGQPLPAGVYYYIIDTKVNGQVLSGYVTILR